MAGAEEMADDDAVARGRGSDSRTAGTYRYGSTPAHT